MALEAEGPAESVAREARARSVFERAFRSLRETPELKEEAVMLLEAWRAFEAENSTRCALRLDLEEGDARRRVSSALSCTVSC